MLILDWSDDRRHSPLEDACFLACNRRQVVPKEFLVIEANRSNPGNDWSDDVRRIEPAAQSCLDHGNIDFLFCEVVKRHRRSDLEECRAHFFCVGSAAFQKVDNVLLGNRLIVDDNPLREIDEMRRHVSPDAQSFRSQQFVERDDHAALSVGPCNVKGFESLVWIAEYLEKAGGSIETELRSGAGAREQRIDRGLVGAQAAVHPAAAGLPLM